MDLQHYQGSAKQYYLHIDFLLDLVSQSGLGPRIAATRRQPHAAPAAKRSHRPVRHEYSCVTGRHKLTSIVWERCRNVSQLDKYSPDSP
jgi:alkaline phosphatase